MAANLFGRYVWLIEQFRRYGRLTYKEIDELWGKSRLSYGYGDRLALRTFHQHRQAIFDIFELDIRCDTKHGYKYYIDNPEDLETDHLRSWLIDSYSAMNQIQADRQLKGRILFENVPSGHQWLNLITDAMRNNQVLNITYQGFGKHEAASFDIEPYYLKVVKRRWYVLARSPYYSDCNIEENKADGGNRPEDVYRLYALDRIAACETTGSTFSLKQDFDIEEYFRGCCGIIHSEEPPQRVVIKAFGRAADYLRSLPLHESQREIDKAPYEPDIPQQEINGKSNNESNNGNRNNNNNDGNDNNANTAYFELQVCPTYDLYQALLGQADQIEVVSPASVRQQMRHYAQTLMRYYEEK